jgi:uncharacterized cysteine cluster protein YcgN (CxxCxxCC family)
MTAESDTSNLPYWKTTSLEQMSGEQWEALCDGCGKCCLVKLIDDVTDDLHYTDVACKLLDGQSCRCKDYSNRKAKVPDCVILTPKLLEDLVWMPSTCAYRLVKEGKDLPFWHPLVCGDPEMVHEAGISVRGRAVSEDLVLDEQLIDHIVEWAE